MQYLRKFVEGILHVVMCSGLKRVIKISLWLDYETKQVDLPGQNFSKNINAKYFACDFWVRGVITFGGVLYCNHLPVNFIVCLLLYCILAILSDTNMLWLEIAF